MELFIRFLVSRVYYVTQMFAFIFKLYLQLCKMILRVRAWVVLKISVDGESDWNLDSSNLKVEFM